MEIKERIIVESGQFFGKYGIRSITMDFLAEEMAISKRTIYEHFRDKDTLLLEVIKYYREQHSTEALRIINESDNAIEALFRIMRIMIRQMKQVNPLFFHDLKKYHTSIFITLTEKSDFRDYTLTLKLLETGARQGVFRTSLNISIVNATRHVLFDLFNPDSSFSLADYDRKEMFDHIIIPYFRGISTERGVKLIEDFRKILD
ncbi:MAG: TetR/AcrR family transcriptional regulator [Bacteroidetes bacterium]|nr:MAG: TetR/AcrR family transcriptional regulator [Bacteroidota bacterium]